MILNWNTKVIHFKKWTNSTSISPLSKVALIYCILSELVSETVPTLNLFNFYLTWSYHILSYIILIHLIHFPSYPWLILALIISGSFSILSYILIRHTKHNLKDFFLNLHLRRSQTLFEDLLLFGYS